MLANERQVSVSTHHQALSALLFLYRQVLLIDLPWLTEVQHPTRPRRLPAVLTKPEVVALLGAMEGEMALLARLLYGTGMRLMEGLHLRVKDLDLDRQVLIGHPDLGRRWAWFGSSPPPNFRLTHAPGSSAGITCTKNVCHDLHPRPESRRRHRAQPA